MGVRRIRTFPFLLIPFATVTCDPVKTRLSESGSEPIATPGIKQCHWFILLLLLAILTMEFSLDHVRRSHKQNQCSASDSVGLIFTRLYRPTLLIMTLTSTPSLVKTSLKGYPAPHSF